MPKVLQIQILRAIVNRKAHLHALEVTSSCDHAEDHAPNARASMRVLTAMRLRIVSSLSSALPLLSPRFTSRSTATSSGTVNTSTPSQGLI